MKKINRYVIENRQWIFGGIGAAVVTAVLTSLLSSPTQTRLDVEVEGTKAETDLKLVDAYLESGSVHVKLQNSGSDSVYIKEIDVSAWIKGTYSTCTCVPAVCIAALPSNEYHARLKAIETSQSVFEILPADQEDLAKESLDALKSGSASGDLRPRTSSSFW